MKKIHGGNFRMTVGYLDTSKHALWPALTVERLREQVNRAQQSEIICGKCRTVSTIDLEQLIPVSSTPDMRIVDANGLFVWQL